MDCVYLDNNGTTAEHPRVTRAMQEYSNQYWGNPSSSHVFAEGPKAALEDAREAVAALINARPGELVFTSGGSESINWAIKGTALKHIKHASTKNIIVSATEHAAVLKSCEYLKDLFDFQVRVIPVDSKGSIDNDVLQELWDEDTILVCLMLANNEIGTVLDLSNIFPLLSKYPSTVFFSDTTQAIGKIPVDVDQLGVDMLCLAGHKINASKGVGALYIRDLDRQGDKVPHTFIHGASQEFGVRASTVDVRSIVGLGEGCKWLHEEGEEYRLHLMATRDALLEAIVDGLKKRTGEDPVKNGSIKVNGNPENSLPNTLSISFKGENASKLLQKLKPYVAASAGAYVFKHYLINRTCHSGSQQCASHVLKAINLDTEYAFGTLRLTTGFSTTFKEISTAADHIIKAIYASYESYQ